MKQYSTILFDLDGTIIDSAKGVIASVKYALSKFNITDTDEKTLFSFLGPPLQSSFSEIMGFSPKDTELAVTYYREYYTQKGIFEVTLYDGIDSVLRKLSEAGKTVVVCTSKPEVFAKKILEHLNIAEYFTLIAGATFDETRSEKSDIIKYALTALNANNRSDILMIGDRKFDIIGAKTIGVDSMGVLYGYGSLEELQGHGATYIAKTPEDITQMLL